MMPNWYEVFDNAHVRVLTRKRARGILRVLLGAVVVSVAAVGAVHQRYAPASLVLGAVGVTWLVVIARSIHQVRKLRRMVWCIKLSDRRIEGYDYARRKIVFDWTRVTRIALDREGLVVMGAGDRALVVSHLFPEFATLSHRIVSYADFYEIPLFLEGRPWDTVDVFDLYPFLTDDTPTGHAG